MLLVAILVLVGLTSSTTPSPVNEFLKDAIASGIWQYAPPGGATIFVCSTGTQKLNPVDLCTLPLGSCNCHLEVRCIRRGD